MKRDVTIVAALVLCTACSHNAKFDATGSFEATEVTVPARAAGTILSLKVEEGDTLSAGALVGAVDSLQAYLACAALQENVKSVTAGRPQIEKQIAATREEIAKQKLEVSRVEKLLGSGAATGKQWDDVNSTLKVLEGRLAAQLSTLHNTASSIDAQASALDLQRSEALDRLDKCRIVSPVSGTVLALYARAGEWAAPGKPLFKVADLHHLFLRAYVTSKQLASLKLGQQVTARAQFGGGAAREYKGVITWISPESEFTPKNIQTADDRADRVYAIKIAVENDGYIKIGTYGEVLF